VTLIGGLIGLLVVILAAIDLIWSYAKHKPVAPNRDAVGNLIAFQSWTWATRERSTPNFIRVSERHMAYISLEQSD
jgi:hypothetical protein